jgi:hypothetical protein
MPISIVGFAVADEDRDRLATGQDYEALQAGIRESYKDGTRSR